MLSPHVHCVSSNSSRIKVETRMIYRMYSGLFLRGENFVETNTKINYVRTYTHVQQSTKI